MGNLMNMMLCRGNEDNSIKPEDRRFYEGYRAGKESQELKKKYTKLLEAQKKVTTERDELKKRTETQVNSITDLEATLEKYKCEMEERIKELSARNQMLMDNKKRIERELLVRDEEKKLIEEELNQYQTRSLPQLERKIRDLQNEQEVLVAENDGLDGEIGELELENESLKKLLEHIRKRQDRKKSELLEIQNSNSQSQEI